MDKELKALVKALEQQGFTTRRTTKGHVMVSLNGRVITVFAGTPSDHRSWRNSLAPLKRAGFRWPA